MTMTKTTSGAARTAAPAVPAVLPRPTHLTASTLGQWQLGTAPMTRNPALKAALADLPGYVDAVERLNAAGAFRATVAAAREVAADTTTETVLDLLLTTPDVTLEQAMKAVSADVLAAQTRAAVHAGADAAVTSTADDLGRLLDYSADDLRSHLHRQLMDVLDEAAPLVDTLRADLDAGTAILSGREEAWRTAQSVIRQHRDIREAQRYLDVQQLSSGLPIGYDSIRFVKDMLTIHPDHPFYVAGLAIVEGRATRNPTAPPWPDPESPSFIAWQVENRAHAWVPTSTQLANAAEKLDTATWKARSSVTRPISPDQRAALNAQRRQNPGGFDIDADRQLR